jgi:hypothetical protein
VIGGGVCWSSRPLEILSLLHHVLLGGEGGRAGDQPGSPAAALLAMPVMRFGHYLDVQTLVPIIDKVIQHKPATN